MRITNPVFFDLINLKLTKRRNLIKLNEKTRDADINVFKDTKTKIIFLEKAIRKKSYYKNIDYGNKRSKQKFFSTTRTKLKKFVTEKIDDDDRRYKQYKNLFKNKSILDFGCGTGDFLAKIKNAKLLNGVELRKNCIKKIMRNYPNIKVYDDIKNINQKFDFITMFHVLEHIEYQIQTLKKLKFYLKNKGKLIIEVPHANDFLLNIELLKDFRKFTFWSEHLVLHTEKSLKVFLKKAGFKKINISYFQRYPLSNHLFWIINKKPGGHIYFKNLISKKLNNYYIDYLKESKHADTLIAECSF
jgi:2-polyprenyl-3-methyl-5-hydroxy-6-metoxy-1,4-benzoquinol methylase